jgi:hypothetical protein
VQVADEVLTSLRTVAAMNGEAQERKRYNAAIEARATSFLPERIISLSDSRFI